MVGGTPACTTVSSPQPTTSNGWSRRAPPRVAAPAAAAARRAAVCRPRRSLVPRIQPPHLPRRVALGQDAHELEGTDIANDADMDDIGDELLDQEPVTRDDSADADADLARELEVARRNSSAPSENTAAQEALDEALKKCKTAALKKGKKVAKTLTEYHRLRRLRETLRGVVGAEHLNEELLISMIQPLSLLPGFRGGDPRTFGPKVFRWAGLEVTIVPRPACRVWAPDDEADRYGETWSERGVFQHMGGSDHASAHLFERELRQAKRHKAASRDWHLQIAYDMSDTHQKLDIRCLSDLPAVNKLVMELGSHFRNGPSQFFEVHEAIRSYVGIERTPDAVTFDSGSVIHYERLLQQETMDLKETALRADLSLAMNRMSLGQPNSRWDSVEARTEAIVELQRTSEKRRVVMSDEDKSILKLYRVMLTFGVGDYLWRIWHERLVSIDAMRTLTAEDEKARMCERASERARLPLNSRTSLDRRQKRRRSLNT